MNNWRYKDGIIDEQPIGKSLGFVYKITHIPTGKYYIGKKQFWKAVRRKPLKGKKGIRKDRVPSDWLKYNGSSKKFLEFINENKEEDFLREILSIHNSKSMLAYEELIQQIKHDVLRDKLSFNSMINIRINKLKED